MFIIGYGSSFPLTKAAWVTFKFTYVKGSHDIHDLNLRRVCNIKQKNYHKNENNPRLYDLAGEYFASH